MSITTKDLVVGNVLRMKPNEMEHRESPHLVNNDCLMGLEIETESLGILRRADIDVVDSWWNLVSDASLRGPSSVEFVLMQPLAGVNLVNAVNAISLLFDRKHTDILVDQPRCGMHIHLDVRSLTLKQLQHLLIIYLVTNPLLFKLGGDRGSNIYCTAPSLCNTELRNNLSRLAAHSNCMTMSSIMQDYKGGRYCGINLHALQKYGSVEFRMFATRYNQQYIMTCVNSCLSLWQWAVNQNDTPVETLLKLPEVISSRGFDSFLVSVFGEGLWDKLKYPAYEAPLLEGVRQAQEVIYYTNFLTTDHDVRLLNHHPRPSKLILSKKETV